MKRLTYGILSSLLILFATVPVRANTAPIEVKTAPTITIAQASTLTIEQMYEKQRVLSDELQTMMAELKAMTAELKAVTALPPGKSPTMADLYRQQQVILERLNTLSQTRIDSVLPRKVTATPQDVYQQQQAMLTEMKAMMAEIKQIADVYRGRADQYKK